MKNFKFLLLLWALSLVLFGGIACKKDNAEKLPPATQKGANTFGFLLNGKVWLPKGGLLDPKLDLSYDPNYKGGTLNILARRFSKDGNHHYLSIGKSGISKIGVYDLFGSFNDGLCYYVSTVESMGTLTITKIDLTNLFISGTFEFKLEKEGCPTINATQGRFDLRIQ